MLMGSSMRTWAMCLIFLARSWARRTRRILAMQPVIRRFERIWVSLRQYAGGSDAVYVEGDEHAATPRMGPRGEVDPLRM